MPLASRQHGFGWFPPCCHFFCPRAAGTSTIVRNYLLESVRAAQEEALLPGESFFCFFCFFLLTGVAMVAIYNE